MASHDLLGQHFEDLSQILLGQAGIKNLIHNRLRQSDPKDSFGNRKLINLFGTDLPAMALLLGSNELPESTEFNPGFARSFFTETPMTDYAYADHSQETGASLSPDTVALAQSDKAKQKAIRLFQNSPVAFRVIFLNWNAPTGRNTYDRLVSDKPLSDEHGIQGRSLKGDITAYSNSNKYGTEIPPELLPYVDAARMVWKNHGPRESASDSFVRSFLPDMREPRQGANLYEPGNPNPIAAGNFETLKQRYPDAIVKLRYTPGQLKGLQTKYQKWLVRKAELVQIYITLTDRYYTEIAEPLGVPDSIKSTPGEITFVLNSDDGDTYYPMTGWMIAHRFGHALTDAGLGKPLDNLHAEFNYLIGHVEWGPERPPSLEPYRIGLACQVGQFRSAREKNIAALGEFYLDCMAQYLIKGRLTFNTDITEITPVFDKRSQKRYSAKAMTDYSDKHSTLPVKNPEAIRAELIKIEDRFNSDMGELLSTLKGRVIAN